MTDLISDQLLTITIMLAIFGSVMTLLTWSHMARHWNDGRTVDDEWTEDDE